MSYNIHLISNSHCVVNWGLTHRVRGLDDLAGPDKGGGLLLGRALSHCAVLRPGQFLESYHEAFRGRRFRYIQKLEPAAGLVPQDKIT